MGVRALIVEDHTDSREALKTLLELWGHPTVAVATGDEALALADGYRPDVAIVDLTLPDVDGVELGSMLASHFNHRPFMIALAGLGGDANGPRAGIAGFDRFLLKPTQLDELRRVLDGLAASRATG
jgi:CheY-like chemotaxis protein